MENLSPGVWSTESFRLTAFITGSSVPKDVTWWHDLTGELPEKTTSTPKTGGFQEEGKYQNSMLALSVLPGRVDWFLYPAEDQPQQLIGFDIVGPLLESQSHFVAIMQKWLSMAPPINRLAFGA